MQKLSDRVLKLLQGGGTLREARLKALKITNEIQGFGSSVNSPLSSSPYSSSSEASSSFCSFSTTSSITPAFMDSNEYLYKHHSPSNDHSNIVFPSKNVKHVDKNHLWNGAAGEEGDILIDFDDDEDENVEKPKGFVSGIYSKIIGNGTAIGGRREEIEYVRCVSDVGTETKGTEKKFDRQHSLWF